MNTPIEKRVCPVAGGVMLFRALFVLQVGVLVALILVAVYFGLLICQNGNCLR